MTLDAISPAFALQVKNVRIPSSCPVSCIDSLSLDFPNKGIIETVWLGPGMRGVDISVDAVAHLTGVRRMYVSNNNLTHVLTSQTVVAYT